MAKQKLIHLIPLHGHEVRVSSMARYAEILKGGEVVHTIESTCGDAIDQAVKWLKNPKTTKPSKPAKTEE